MSATQVRREPKLLTGVAPESGADNKAAPAPSQDSAATQHYSLEEIHRRAEMVTPLLREILDFRPPPHWGINE